MKYIFYVSLICSFIYFYYLINRFSKTRTISGQDILMMVPLVNIALFTIGVIIIIVSKLVDKEWVFKKNETKN